MATATQEVTKRSTFRDIEEQHAALVDTLDIVEPEQESQIKTDIANALKSALAKRASIAYLIEDRADRIAEARAHVKKVEAWIRAEESKLNRFKAWVVDVIKSFGVNEKGKYRAFEFPGGALRVASNPPSAIRVDEKAETPLEFLEYTVRVPASVWRDMTAIYAATHPDWTPIGVKDVHVDREGIKAAILAGMDVPGWDVKTDGVHLRV